MRVIRKQQSAFFDIFMASPSLAFYTLLVLLNWKVSPTLIGLVPLMIGGFFYLLGSAPFVLVNKASRSSLISLV